MTARARRDLQLPLLIAWLALAATFASTAGDAPAKDAPSPGGAVTLVWCCAGTADVYFNGKPLRDAKPDFLTRADETGWEYSAKAELKVDDVLTVGARRGGKGSGFRLAAFDHKNRLVWQTETANWRSYGFKDPRSAKQWYVPATAGKAKLAPVTVPSKAFPPMEQFEQPRTEVADSIWSQDANMVFLYAKITARRNFVRLPMRELAWAGKVKYFVNDNNLFGLQPDDLDGSNRIKRYKQQPLRYLLEFAVPTEIHGTVVNLADHKGTFTWQVDCADSRDDMAKKAGTYRAVAKPQQTRADEAVDILWKPIKAACWQLTASKDAAGPISLRKFELLVPVDD